ncbi:MAG: abortive phage infection protein [Eubacterium sp.]|nr:abortive phage infection protein [Eubacterium sp.]
MTKNEMLERQTKNGNGYLIVADAVNAGISKQYISEFIKKKNMEKAAPGVYVDGDTWVDELYIISLRNNIVFSHETALYLHGLTEQEPNQVSLTVGKGYNASRLRKRNCRVYTDLKDMLNVGKTTVNTNQGNSVPVYDIDRTICDIIKIKDKMDIQVFQFAIKEYMKRKDKNLHNLMQYAKMMKIEDKVRIYTEVML